MRTLLARGMHLRQTDSTIYQSGPECSPSRSLRANSQSCYRVVSDTVRMECVAHEGDLPALPLGIVWENTCTDQ